MQDFLNSCKILDFAILPNSGVTDPHLWGGAHQTKPNSYTYYTSLVLKVKTTDL